MVKHAKPQSIVSVKIDTQKQWGLWEEWFHGIGDGNFKQSLNSVGVLSMTLNNPIGHKFIHPGQTFRVWLGWNNTFYNKPLFIGLVQPESISITNNKQSQTISFSLSDYISILSSGFSIFKKEQLLGMELSQAIRYIMINSVSDYLDWSGSGTNPQQFIREEDKQESLFDKSNKELIDSIISLGLDNSNLKSPKRYFYYQDNDASYDFKKPKFVFKKEIDPNYMDIENPPLPVRVLDEKKDLIQHIKEYNKQICNSCIFKNGKDYKIYGMYEDKNFIDKFTRFQKVFSSSSENSDELQEKAYQYVQLNKVPTYSLSVDILEGVMLRLLDLVEIKNSKFDIDGKYIIKEINTRFSSTSLLTTLGLSNRSELGTDYL